MAVVLMLFLAVFPEVRLDPSSLFFAYRFLTLALLAGNAKLPNFPKSGIIMTTGA